MVEVVKNNYAKMEASVRGGVDRAVTAVRKRQAVWAARAADSIAGKNRILRRAGYEKWEVRDMMQRHIICFLAGTLVLTANGAVAIENIQPGMQVWSRHEVTGQAGFKPVVYRFETQSGELLDLVYETADGEQHELTTTPEHPFYIAQEDAWFAAEDLVAGDQVMTATSETADVIRVAAKRGPPEGTPTYNLAVADHHTYFVAAEGTPEAKQWSTALWVHNTGRGKCNEEVTSFDGDTDEFLTFYHATSKERAERIRINGINLNFSRLKVDFGKGFYTTTNKTQAQDWMKQRFKDSGELISFKVRRGQLEKLKTLNAENLTNSSLSRFIRHNRLGGKMHSFDIVNGPLLLNIRFFIKGRPGFFKGQQTSFHSKDAIDLLFKGLE